MKYKLICIDMDGTLLNTDNQVSDDNIKALKKATEMGIHIAITTGRIYASAKYYSGIVGIDAPIITANGASIKDSGDGNVIYNNPIPSDILIGCAEILKKHNLKANFTTGDTIFTSYEIPETHSYKITNKIVPNEFKVNFLVFDDIKDGISKFEGKILKCFVGEDGNLEGFRNARTEITKTFGNFLHIVSSGVNNFEIMQKDSSKGNAAKMLAKRLGITKDEVICIGDSENDLSMIQFAGMGVAMGNAMDLLKSEADFITETNNNSGVAKAIEKFCF
ncbi:Cof-type HAD-IIB family hydrolase [Clostridium gasigenes]|uniref:Cof-type HAD-IIB family hydrolase n=1 Tax=Clostridium gasigenes TaxID=94869 RepID=UPI001C0AB526|nr:Cof-type HAD-IIB family hydrolase [Clostridium gasigenes]MBU3134078.1 Cof-type HAD-IIB family hydrolase [Clostridium gasigenes]